MSQVIIACGMQKAYISSSCSRYFGQRTETLKERLKDYFTKVPKDSIIFFTREVRQSNDSFFRTSKSYGLVGTPDIEIPEIFKPYPKFIINTTRHSAFYKTPLESELHKIKPSLVSLVGFETHTTVLFTAEELRNREYEVHIEEPLVISEDDFLHTAAINILSNTLSVLVE